MNYKDLNLYLSKEADINTDKMKNFSIDNNNHSYDEIYLILIALGDVFNVDKDNKRYAARIKSGLFKKNVATLAVQYYEDKLDISIFSSEGIISQNTNERVIDELKRKIS